MPAYVRPPIPRQVFHDADGRPYEYGERWADLDGPPEDTYSVDSHPERFAPVVDVADALVAHLVATYDVAVETADLRGLDVSAHMAQAPAHPVLRGVRRVDDDAVRATRLVPAVDDAAPLTLVVTDYPGVHVHAGALHEETFPACGCDACDDTAEAQAEQLEHLVLAVAAGRFAEGVRRAWDDPRTAWVRYVSWSDDDSRAGEGRRRRRGLKPARRRLAALPNGRWSPWPTRA
ncbi:DUF6226 family protein [Cellulosimicrobium cellulans]|uniref:DUF6226 family protein n=1 Tax=Cellulosimicrobium cellulans TaxID=1710 RepID=UPI00084967F5|nr:DUF6226 family protein [Cellulosimicrobium cellulans]